MNAVIYQKNTPLLFYVHLIKAAVALNVILKSCESKFFRSSMSDFIKKNEITGFDMQKFALQATLVHTYYLEDICSSKYYV